MTENVSSQPAPQAEALLRLEPGAQNQSASLGAAHCWFGEKQEEGRAIGLSCCWTQKGGGLSHGQKALLAVEAGPCLTQVLSWTPSHGLSGSRSCPCWPWAWAETSFLLPPAMGLQWAPEVTNPTKAQGERGFAPAQELLQGCSWKQRMSRALQRVLSKPKIHSGVWDQDTAGVE